MSCASILAGSRLSRLGTHWPPAPPAGVHPQHIWRAVRVRRHGASPGLQCDPGGVVTSRDLHRAYNVEKVTRLVAAALFCLGLVSAAAQPPAAPELGRDVQTVGPQVGATIPSFTLPDQTGRLRSLESLMGPKGAMLVFFRSADW